MGSYLTNDEISNYIYGEPKESTLRYLRREVERYSDRIGDVFDNFFSDARDVFERFNGVSALRRIRKRLRESENLFDKDIVLPLTDMKGLQTAKSVMQRYIMCNPISRQLEESQCIDSYSDSYRNPYPGRKSFDDPDYMRVIDGFVFTENYHDIKIRETEDAWIAYQDLNYNEDERELFLAEQMDILSTWEVLEHFYAQKGKDPTSILNEDM